MVINILTDYFAHLLLINSMALLLCQGQKYIFESVETLRLKIDRCANFISHIYICIYIYIYYTNPDIKWNGLTYREEYMLPTFLLCSQLGFSLWLAFKILKSDLCIYKTIWSFFSWWYDVCLKIFPFYKIHSPDQISCCLCYDTLLSGRVTRVLCESIQTTGACALVDGQATKLRTLAVGHGDELSSWQLYL